MAINNRADLRNKFANRKKPDENDFGDLFDSFLNKIDDKIVVDEKKNIGIGLPEGSTINNKLHINGSLRVDTNADIARNLDVGRDLTVHKNLKFDDPSGTSVNIISNDSTMGEYQPGGPSEHALVTQAAIKEFFDLKFINSVGFIIPYTRKDNTINLPEGWLLCNGGFYDAEAEPKYSNLYKTIGTKYGNGNGGGMSFNVPKITITARREVDDWPWGGLGGLGGTTSVDESLECLIKY